MPGLVTAAADPTADPSANGGPTAPVGSPLEWTVMAYTRREGATTAGAQTADTAPMDWEADPAHELACLRVRMSAPRRAAVRAWLDTAAVRALLQGEAAPTEASAA